MVKKHNLANPLGTLPSATFWDDDSNWSAMLLRQRLTIPRIGDKHVIVEANPNGLLVE